MPKRYRSIADLPDALPVFPLAGAILMPRARLPLNIFEPRYLEMIDDCLRGGRLVGIVQPEGDGGSTGSPRSRSAALRSVGCVGRITAYQEQDDGRLVIALTGVARFDTGGELSTIKPYRIFQPDFRRFAVDLAPDRTESNVDREKLLSTLKRFLHQRQLQIDWDQVASAGIEALVNGLAVASPFAPGEKQALLEAETLEERAKVLMALAEMDLADPGGSSGRLQ